MHGNQPGRGVCNALAAGIAGHFAQLRRSLASQRNIALHVQLLIERYKFEQVPRTRCNTIGAGAAFLSIHLREPVGVHVNGVEGARGFAIRQPETAPGTSFAAAGYYGRCSTTFETLVFSNLVSLQVAAVTTQAGNQLLSTARVHLEILGDLLESIVGTDCALPRFDFTGYQFFCERQAARLSAGATIGARQ